MSKKAMTKVAWSIEDARQVLSGGASKVDGMLLDHFSASALVQIYDALSPENQAKLEAMPLDRAMDIVWKLASKTGSRDTEQYVVDDFAHEAKIERHAIADEFDLRPLHTRVATAFLKKG